MVSVKNNDLNENKRFYFSYLTLKKNTKKQ